MQKGGNSIKLVLDSSNFMNQEPVTQANDQGAGMPRLRVFNPVAKFLWIAIVAVTIVTEVIPIPLMPKLQFYSYCGAKVFCFVAVGYLAPLAFWRFNALNRGILLASISATCVESLQGLLHRGHSFHWYELAVKLALILAGFALALDARYERQISVGPIHVRLTGEHIER